MALLPNSIIAAFMTREAPVKLRMLAPAIARVIAPPDPRYAALGLDTTENLDLGADTGGACRQTICSARRCWRCCRRRRCPSARRFLTGCAAP